MQPGGKSRLAPKGPNLAKQLHEGFLGQVLRLGGIVDHAQAERVNPPLMQTVDGLKGTRITGNTSPDRFFLNSLCRWYFFGFQSCLLEAGKKPGEPVSLYKDYTKLAMSVENS